MAKRRDKSEERDLAMDRIERLGALTEAAASEGKDDLAARYIELARRIGMRNQVALPTAMSRRACRGCGTHLVPGRTARVRVRDGRTITTCLACDRVKRVPLRETRAPRGARARAGGSRRRSGSA